MSFINAGYVVLNEAPLAPSDKAAFCILGLPRGGTTMTAKLVQAAGISIGERLPVTAEDPEFASLLQLAIPDQREFGHLVTRRFEQHLRWGFKAPYRNHWELLRKIPHVRFVIVYRDTLAVANRNRISANADLLPSMLSNITREGEITKFAASVTSPIFMFSYEKALVEPDPVVDGLMAFCGAEKSEARQAEMKKAIRPADMEYIEGVAPKKNGIRCNLDVVTPQRVAGWVRAPDGYPIRIEVLHDETLVGEVTAQNYRSDLAAHFGDHGRHGFDLTIVSPLSPGKPVAVIVRDKSDKQVLARRVL